MCLYFFVHARAKWICYKRISIESITIICKIQFSHEDNAFYAHVVNKYNSSHVIRF